MSVKPNSKEADQGPRDATEATAPVDASTTKKKRDYTKAKNVSNPFSTGGGGTNFETRVQAVFAILMLARGFAPCLPRWPISSITLQARRLGFEIDDVVVSATEAGSTARLLCQVKHSISFVDSDSTFGEVISAAWREFNGNFARGRDALAIVVGPLSARDLEVRTLLEWSRTSASAQEYFEKVGLANFSSATKQEKQAVIERLLKIANKGNEPDREDVWLFLKSLHILQFDLDSAAGVNHSLADCVLSQFSGYHFGIWPSIVDAVQTLNQNAGTIIRRTFPEHIVKIFDQHSTIIFESEVLGAVGGRSEKMAFEYLPELAIAQLIGSWNEEVDGDRRMVERISGESYESFVKKLRLDLRRPNYPLRFRQGIWSVGDRLSAWREHGDMVFSEHLDRLSEVAIEVLTSTGDEASKGKDS